ncbi:hypothetical protein MF672_011375 [Actinomadura sp. ATCC 31491]|uniref:Subtilisin inhibitor domain-containing protein n=1 Tax=Actinomadura luzonensis TaxID=2805427 RepID=A0ABT0FQ15_9ACTN|nr:hypothetical protein [Actinomadura luzonensis]MCK2214386.1 hypothetical protein [Actinomadura luzonensis]
MRVHRRFAHGLAAAGVFLAPFAAAPPARAANDRCEFSIGTPKLVLQPRRQVESVVRWNCLDVTDGQFIADLWLCSTRAVRKPAGVWYCRVAQKKDDMKPRLRGTAAGETELFSRSGRGLWCVNASWWYKYDLRVTWGTKRSRSCPFLDARGD